MPSVHHEYLGFILLDHTWLVHASFRLDLGGIVYFDPFNVKGPADADFILVSQGHYDHCDPASIFALSKANIKVFCPWTAAGKVGTDPQVMFAGDTAAFRELKVEAHRP
jgi:L-ascorbate metabolism protein UlaG (beta-lactamase superfamily)